MLRQIKTKIAQKIPRLPRWGKRGIALLSVLCIAISLFCFPVGALSSFAPSFSKMNYVSVVGSSGTRIEGVDGDASGINFGKKDDFVYAVLPSVVNNPVIISFKVPFTINVPKGNYWSGSFKMRPTFLDENSYCLSPYSNLSVRAKFDDEYTKVFGSEGSPNGEWVTIDLPPNTSSGFIYFSFYFSPDSNFNLKILRIYFKDFDFKYGLEGEISAENSQNQEQEKANKGGKDSSDKAANAIPSVNEGFGNALKSFVNSMSYDGTEAKLPVPRTYIPSLSGVTDEITLIPEQEYDLSQAIKDYLPSTLLQLIRHLFTIALVLYCVYELYGLIQYVLTLKKGGKD